MLDVADLTLEQSVVVRPGGKFPDALSGQVGGAAHQVHQRLVVSEGADRERAERSGNGSGERGDVDDMGRALVHRIGDAIREDEPAFGISVDDLDRLAARAGYHVARLDGLARWHVLRGRN